MKKETQFKIIQSVGIITILIAWALIVFVICMNTPNEVIYYERDNTWYMQRNQSTFYYNDMKGKWVKHVD